MVWLAKKLFFLATIKEIFVFFFHGLACLKAFFFFFFFFFSFLFLMYWRFLKIFFFYLFSFWLPTFFTRTIVTHLLGSTSKLFYSGSYLKLISIEVFWLFCFFLY